MPDTHARLSASGAKRWLNCPRSIALEETFPEEESAFAEEGTSAHALAESLLRIFHDTGRRDFTPQELGEDKEMSANVMDYVAYVLDLYDTARLLHSDAFFYIEQRLDFSDYVPEGFGTGDFVLIYEDTIVIVDLKYGKGVPVSAVENPQMRLYALGALKEHGWVYDLRNVQTHIVQPRLERNSVERIAVSDLTRWGEDVVRPAAHLAANDLGEFVPGEHCQFCKAKPICKARAERCLGAIEAILRKEAP